MILKWKKKYFNDFYKIFGGNNGYMQKKLRM